MAKENSGIGVGGITAAVTIGILLAVGLIVVVLMIATSNDGLDCSTRNADRAANGQRTLDCQ